MACVCAPCAPPSSAFATPTLYVDAAHRGYFGGRVGPGVQYTVFCAVMLQKVTGGSPCGNIMAPACVSDGSVRRRSKSPRFVADQRVSPPEMRMCMLPERSIRKRTSDLSFVAW